MKYTVMTHSRVKSSVQFSSITQLCPTLCDPMDCSIPGFPELPELTQTHVHWVGDAIPLSHPLSSLSPPPSIFPSIRVFSNESVLCIRWPKFWSFSFNISPSNKDLRVSSLIHPFISENTVTEKQKLFLLVSKPELESEALILNLRFFLVFHGLLWKIPLIVFHIISPSRCVCF